MSKVLFSHSYFYRFDPKQWKTGQPYPPLMTIQAAAILREKGYNVSLFDTCLVKNTSEITNQLEKIKPDFFVIFDDGFNYLTKMCLTNMREAAFSMLTEAKKFGCTTIVCSSDATDHYDKYLENGADFVIKGEGEMALLAMVTQLESGEIQPTEIEGIAWKNNGEIFQTSKNTVMHDLDTLPLPAWDLIDIEAYKNIWIEKNGYFTLNLATTRGCPFKCNWCAKPIYGNRYNSRSPQKVVDEIAYLINQFGVKYFWMCDDIFGLKPGWVKEFNKEVKERNLKFKYKIQSRADLLLEEETINALAESGADMVWIGAESGSQKILDAMDKGINLLQIENATQKLQSKGIKVAFFIQFGYLGELKEDIDKTINMVLNLMPDDIGVSVSYPLPGTKFFEMVKQDLEKKANWRDSDDLDLMFHNTFPPAYYKKLQRYLHKIYRRKKGIQNLKIVIKNPKKLNLKNIKSITAALVYTPITILENLHLKSLAVHAK